MPLPTYSSVAPPKLKTLCCYLNSTHEMQLILVKDCRSPKLAKIVFPHQRFLFEAMSNEKLEVYIEREGKEVLQSAISCNDLLVD